MRATLMYGAGDVRVENIPDAALIEQTDAVVRIVRSCVCGSDLHPYHSMPTTEVGVSKGHEFIGVVEEVGSEVRAIRKGDFVVSPFAYSDGTCTFCLEGRHPSCRHGGFLGSGAPGIGGAQAEAIRIPWADGTLVKADVAEDSALLPSLLALTDVFLTGHHAAMCAKVSPRTTVAVMGDGAVGLSGVLAAKRLGAERIILLGRHEDRTALGREFGATDVVAERGKEAVERVRELTGGDGAHAVLECVGLKPAYETALGIVRHGGTIARVGVPQYDEASIGMGFFRGAYTLTGGPALVRAYLPEFLPEVLEGRLDPGRVFDVTMPLDDATEAYRAMDERRALKVMLTP